MNLNQEEVIIFSVYQATKTMGENLKNHIHTVAELVDKVPFKQVKGCYKGQIEDSIMVRKADLKQVSHLFTEVHPQESFLEIAVDGTTYATTVATGHTQLLGRMTEVESTFGRDAWTKVNGKYWVAS